MQGPALVVKFRVSFAAVLFVLIAIPTSPTSAADLKTVGILGNTAGMSDRPVPYAYYTGIGMDALGRLFLVGDDKGVVMCDQDGQCLAILPLADKGAANSVVVRAGAMVCFVATAPQGSKSVLYRIDTTAADVSKLRIEKLAEGPGHWAVSPAPEVSGRVLVGRSEPAKLRYTVSAIDPVSANERIVCTIEEPKGATSPWRHALQLEPDASVSITHHGGVNFSGRYDFAGKRLGEARGGQILDAFRYQFGYDGNLRRMDLTDEHASPGDCGSPANEIRMPTQVVRFGERYFFAGRGGAVEAKFNGGNFVYTRRIGGCHIEDFFQNGDALRAVAFTSSGNNDVQHLADFPTNQPIGEMLKVAAPLHTHRVLALVPAPQGVVLVYSDSKGVGLAYEGAAKQFQFDIKLPQAQSVGQAAVYKGQLLLADPKAGVIWARPLLDKTAPPVAWKSDLPGVIAIASAGDALFIATPTAVSRLSVDGKTTLWKSATNYQGIRRIAATPEHVYVCDTAASIVDQLDAATGAQTARLGTSGQSGASLGLLDHPWSVAADMNGVYVADNGNGRIVIATTTLWKPEIAPLPRDDGGPVVAVTIPAKPPAAGRISLNVFDENDLTVRQLACAAPAGQPITWDGRDLYGKWVKPGTYRYHGIVAPKLSLKYVTSVEQSGSPAYRTPDGAGSWGGVWGYIYGICPVNNQPDSDIIVLWAFEEGEGGLIRMSQDGKVRWKAHLDWWMKAQQMAVACDGASVYILGASAMNAPDGQRKYGGEFNRPLLWRVDAATGAKKPFPQTDQQNQKMLGRYMRGVDHIASDIVYHEGKLYVTAPKQDLLFVVDPTTGNSIAEWTIPSASGVAFDTDGNVVAGSGTKIVKLDAKGQIARTIADAGGAIWSIRSAGKDAFAASVGEPRHQIVYFDAAGHELRALGSKGGRPLCGKMQPASFRDPTALCFTGNGKLFVAEAAAPKRFTRWSADGNLERQFHGPYYYSGMFGVDEEDPQFIYGDTHGDIIRYKLDYNTGAWDVDHYWIGVYDPKVSTMAKWWPRIRHHEGKTWWCSGSGAIVELNDEDFNYVAQIYTGMIEDNITDDFGEFPELVKPGPKTRTPGVGSRGEFRGTHSRVKFDRTNRTDWQLTPPDKCPYPDPKKSPQQGWGAYFDEQFNCYLHDWSDDEAGGVWEMPVTEWREGVPIYKWDAVRHVAWPLGHGLQHGGGGARTAFAAGDAVYAFNGAYNAAHLPGVGHGADWEFAQITKYDAKTGKPLWHAGERAAGFATAGQMYCPTGAGGIVGDFLFWTDENSLVHVWDVKHGLYVDTLLEDGMRGPPPSPYNVWVELFNTRVFRHPKTGKIYLMAASDAIHVYEVLGADQSPASFDGQVTVTQADLDRAQAVVQSRTATHERTLRIVRAKGPVKIDGNLDEFAAAPAVELNLREGARGSARLMHDDKNLYIAFDVTDDSPWKNAGSDLSTLFKTGDCIDVWLGPSMGKRALGASDVRVLFAPVNGKATAVAFRPKVDKGKKPVSFRSPSGEVVMDRVQELTDVRLAVQTTASGYRLEAAIPLSDVSLDGPVDRIGLDLSINFSDPAGQRNVARIHWGRNGAAMVYDLPSESRLEPETWGVGIWEK